MGWSTRTALPSADAHRRHDAAAVAHGVKVISIGMFLRRRGESPTGAVAWRGPMLHRTMQQFLTDVYFGDLDVLLLDMPPGTGDVAISVGQLLPHAEVLVVTTPQSAASDVAVRSGLVARQTGQRVDRRGREHGGDDPARRHAARALRRGRRRGGRRRALDRRRAGRAAGLDPAEHGAARGRRTPAPRSSSRIRTTPPPWRSTRWPRPSRPRRAGWPAGRCRSRPAEAGADAGGLGGFGVERRRLRRA